MAAGARTTEGGTPPSPAPAAAGRPRPVAPVWRGKLGQPLTDLHLQRLAELEELAGPGGFEGWGREQWNDPIFIDVLGRRVYGLTMHSAITAAKAAAREALAP